MKAVGLIPARLESSRLPGKLLLDQTGAPLIQYVWQAVKKCRDLDEVIVATDSREIAEVVGKFGGRAELTGDHPSGTDRIAEVVRRCCPDAAFIVNIQGDEPELEAESISGMLNALKNSEAEMATVATPFTSADAVHDPSCVKVVVNDHGEAMYFSRSPIPFARDTTVEDVLRNSPGQILLHLGMYAYRRDVLLQLTEMPPAWLEQTEKLEQLRALQAGMRIAVTTVQSAAVGIDTPSEYAQFVERMKIRQAN